MAIDLNTLRAFEVAIVKDIPGFKVVFKDRSKFMKFLGFLMYPFNDGFMTKFTTTIGDTVYFPSVSHYVNNPGPRLQTLAHEYVHLRDARDHPWTFKLSYLFPQILVVIPLIVFAVLAWPHSWLVLLPFVGYVLGALLARLSKVIFWVIFGLAVAGTIFLGWLLTGWAILSLAGLVLLGPWPAPWRTKWELRGYGMTVALGVWISGSYGPKQLQYLVERFTGPDYFFMSWSGSKVEEALRLKAALAADGTLQGLPPYQMVHDFLYERSFLRRSHA